MTSTSLAFYLGNNTHLEAVHYYGGNHGSAPQALVLAMTSNTQFLKGLKRNVSIRKLQLSYCDLSDGAGRGILTAFQENISNITHISLTRCDLGNAGSDVLASTLRSCTNVEEISLARNFIGDDILDNFISSIKDSCHLKTLCLGGANNMGRAGCEALASLLDEPSSNLRYLDLLHNLIDDDCATVLANALKNNTELETLHFSNYSAITRNGWNAFSKALCDTSSINATYFSNHTLKNIGDRLLPSRGLNLSLLFNNNRSDRKQVAIKKILRRHRRFDMKPFFEWDMKMLPSVGSWFDRARACAGNNEARSVNVRQLDAIYQFIHAMPDTFDVAPKGAKRKRSEIVGMVVHFDKRWEFELNL